MTNAQIDAQVKEIVQNGTGEMSITTLVDAAARSTAILFMEWVGKWCCESSHLVGETGNYLYHVNLGDKYTPEELYDIFLKELNAK